MGKLCTNQKWQMLIEQSESSSLSTLAFFKLNELNPSRSMPSASNSITLTHLVNDVELSISQGTPATYLAELIGALL